MTTAKKTKRIAVSLSPKQYTFLENFAIKSFDGSVSMAVRYLVNEFISAKEEADREKRFS